MIISALENIEDKLAMHNCALCDSPISRENDSEEHIIPNAIGGRKKVSGFICKPCNDQSGHTWDAALAEEARPLCLLLRIKRGRGETPSQTFETIGGRAIRLNYDGTMNSAEAKAVETQKDGKTYIDVKARTPQEARRLLNGFKRKYPDLDIDGIVQKIDSQPVYLNDPLKMSFSFGGPDMGRSFVKSALALAFQNNINPSLCPQALQYLKDQTAEPCFGFYFEKDLILNRPSGRVFHCVAISGNSKTGLLLAYIEYFCAQRVVVCLSNSYSGPDVHDNYAVDPIAGQELDLKFEIPLTREDIAAIYRYEKIPDGAQEAAFRVPMEIARKMDFESDKNRAINSAVDYAIKNCGAAENEIISEEQAYKLSKLAAEKMIPFFRQYATRPNRNISPFSDADKVD